MKLIIEDASRKSTQSFDALRREDANACLLRLIMGKDIDLRPGMVIRIEEDDDR